MRGRGAVLMAAALGAWLSGPVQLDAQGLAGGATVQLPTQPPAPAVAAKPDPPNVPARPEQPTTFRAAVDLVSVAAVVRDRKGRFVRDLAKGDFVVVEGGESKPIIGFQSEEDGPINIAVLVDISGSMRVGAKADEARLAARQVFSSLRPGDQAALFAFDTQVVRVSDFTTRFDGLDAALDRIEPPFGQTSIYDAIADTARRVADEAEKGKTRRRSAVLVITDGIDTKSRLTAPEVSAVASGIDVPIYVLAVMSAIDDPRNTDSGTGSMSSGLKDLSRWTGGDLFISVTPEQANLAARDVVGELRHQYLLAFEASARPGWKRLEVRARDRELVVRARSGYTAGGL